MQSKRDLEFAYLIAFIETNNQTAAKVETKAKVRMNIRVGVNIARDMLDAMDRGATSTKALEQARQVYTTPLAQHILHNLTIQLEAL